jgi:ribosome biogenesis protein MAK21
MTGEKMGVIAGHALALHMLPGELLSDEDVVGDKWFDCVPDWPESESKGADYALEQWITVSEHALAAVSRAFERKLGTSEEARKKILSKEKTIGDKIAAVTLMVQESPLHRLDELRSLLGFAKKKGRRERGPAIDAMKDLFINDLLPSNRRLVAIEARNFRVERTHISKRHLAYAKFESELKILFQDFLAVVDECTKDSVVHFKQKSARVCFDLLAAAPENENALLAMLVNELGSPERRVASSASFYLTQLVSKHHPAMKLVVVRAVEELVHRPNIGLRARYYAISFLNQIRFNSESDIALARKLVGIYMDLFAESVDADRQGTVAKGSGGLETKESRLMGALLTGVNRAFPYSKPESDESDYSKQCEALFQVAHAQSLTSATQALSFLLQVAQSNSTISDRFYRALYCRIPDAADAGESKQALFLHLILKAMKADISARRVKAYAKRLLQASLRSSPGFAASSLLVLSEVMIRNRGGLLKSFVLLSEGGDADEDFRDADSDMLAPEPISCHTGSEVTIAGQDTCANVSQEAPLDAELKSDDGRLAKAPTWGNGYNPMKRDPTFAGAEESCLWELVALCSHFHPSVASFATRLRRDMDEIHYEGDPLKDFTLGSFLDKFSYRKPKKRVVESLHGRRSSLITEKPMVNTESFMQRGEAGHIEEDDKFFLRFFQTNPGKTRRPESADGGKLNEGPRNDDVDGAESEEEAFEEALNAELKRLGGAALLDSDAGDVDEVDEDELQAFHDTFKDELESNDSSPTRIRHMNTANSSVTQGSSSGDAPNITSRVSRKDTKRKSKVVSSFAPVDDYAEQLDAEETNVQFDSEGNGADGVDSAGTVQFSALKRQRSPQGTKGQFRKSAAQKSTSKPVAWKKRRIR